MTLPILLTSLVVVVGVLAVLGIAWAQWAEDRAQRLPVARATSSRREPLVSAPTVAGPVPPPAPRRGAKVPSGAARPRTGVGPARTDPATIG